MTDAEAYQEAEKRVIEHLGKARGALARAELIAQAAGLDWNDPAVLARLQEQIRSFSAARVCQGIKLRKGYVPRELRWALHDDMTLGERLFGRVGSFRHWRYRLRDRARRRAARAGICG